MFYWYTGSYGDIIEKVHDFENLHTLCVQFVRLLIKLSKYYIGSS